MKSLAVLSFCIFLVPGLALAQTKGGQPPQVDLSNAPQCQSVPDGDAPLVCVCAAGEADGSVWGSGPYTADSDICTAAVHAGTIGAAGGALQVVLRPGQDSYAGSERNGVTTNSWGSYGQSFDVLPVSASAAAATPAVVVCGVLPDGADAHSCTCEAGISGSVWGSGPYTADSNICTAARHAGVVGTQGGPVKVLRVQGLGGYEGSSANGETTSGWGSYGASIIFDRN